MPIGVFSSNLACFFKQCHLAASSLKAHLSLGPLWRGSTPQTIGNDGPSPNFGMSSLLARSSDIAAAIWFCLWALDEQVSSTPGCIMTIRMQFPLGACNLPCFFCFFLSMFCFVYSLYHAQIRYLAKDGQAMVVRPAGNPAGTRVYEMQWDALSKSIKVYNPLDGSFITDLPGRWTARKEIGQAVRRCVTCFLLGKERCD